MSLPNSYTYTIIFHASSCLCRKCVEFRERGTWSAIPSGIEFKREAQKKDAPDATNGGSK